MMREGCRRADMNPPPWEIDTPTSHHHTRDQCTVKNHADISKMSFSTHPLLSGLLHGAGAVSPGLVSDVSMSGSISVQCFGLLLTTRRLESWSNCSAKAAMESVRRCGRSSCRGWSSISLYLLRSHRSTTLNLFIVTV